ncbi:MAG: T9SS type A sorting domain-containing protein [Sphingobacteriaceae bacterium]|nr:T9SS type A sorting domain-containing protein [Sphingobacteriaceae bacterium]
MKKIYTLLFVCISLMSARATSYTISTSGTSYSPNTLTVSIGDVITIQASGTHPLAQVDQTTWNANGTATVSGGWGTTTANHTFTVSSANSIYFVCTNHVGSGMKGQITVAASGINENSNVVNSLSIFPVPASETIHLNYSLKESALIEIDMISLSGQKAASLVNEIQLIGTQQKVLNVPSNLASGVYFIQISANGLKTEERLISIK